MNTPLSRLNNILRNGSFSDVSFRVQHLMKGPVINLPAHKLILAMTSDAFADMFFGGLPENNTVDVTDVEPDAFELMLEYCYTGDIKFTSTDLAIGTAYAAKKYLMDHLLELCSKYLMYHLSENSYCKIYEASLLLSEKILSERAMNYMKNIYESVMLSEQFLNLTHLAVFNITQFFSEFVPTNQLFEAIVRWGEANKMDRTLRSLLDPLLPLIPFLAMKSDQFLDVVGSSEVLTDEEVLTIVMNISRKVNDRNKMKPIKALPDWVSTKVAINVFSGEMKFGEIISNVIINYNITTRTHEGCCLFKIIPSGFNCQVFLNGLTLESYSRSLHREPLNYTFIFMKDEKLVTEIHNVGNVTNERDDKTGSASQYPVAQISTIDHSFIPPLNISPQRFYRIEYFNKSYGKSQNHYIMQFENYKRISTELINSSGQSQGFLVIDVESCGVTNLSFTVKP